MSLRFVFSYRFIGNVVCRSVTTWNPYSDYNITKPEYYERYKSNCYITKGIFSKDSPPVGFCAFVSII